MYSLNVVLSYSIPIHVDIVSSVSELVKFRSLAQSSSFGKKIPFVYLLFAITNGMVKVLVEGCFGLDLFDLTNISNSLSCFLATYRENWRTIPCFPYKICHQSIVCTRHT